ncbi:MAG: hypothetical protein ABJN78_02515, partial [Hyphomicrobiales bacterium]
MKRLFSIKMMGLVAVIAMVLFAVGLMPSYKNLARAEPTCGGAVSCVVGNRSYLAVLPDGWNGRDELAVLIHFHGWGRTGKNVINNGKISDATRETDVLLLAPDGLGKSWNFWRSPSQDVLFVEA